MSALERQGVILDAAREAFLSSGYGGARTRDIALRAGVNEALLFRHFATKEEIFQKAVIEPLIEIMSGTLARGEAVVPNEPAADKLARSESTMRQMLEVMQAAVPLLGIVLFAENQQAQKFYREQVTPIFEAGANRLRQRYGTWTHRPYDPDIMSRASTGMCLFLVLDAHFTGRELDLDAAASELAQIVMYGSSVPADAPAKPSQPARRSTKSATSKSVTAASARRKA